MSAIADISISYAAADNGSSEKYAGWVSHLESFLQLFLGNLMDKPIEITMDEDGAKGGKAKASILIISGNHQKVKLPKDAQAIFKVLKSNVQMAEQPESLRGVYGYNLFDGSESDSSLFENSTGSAAWLRLVDLAYDLYEQIADEADKKAAGEKSGKRVFLAEVSSDQEKSRDMIRRELQMHGYEVFPKHHLAANAEAVIQEVNDYLSQSSLAVHIIGENPGYIPEGADVSIVELQNSIAAQYSEKVYGDDDISNDFTRLLWISPDIEFENEQQQMEVDQLKQDMSALRGAEVIQTPIEMFKTIIMRSLNETFELEDDGSDQEGRDKLVYLIYEHAFADNVSPIDEVLKKSGVKTVHPLFDGDQIDLINHHRTNLIDCDATLIYYNDENIHWIESKVKELKKSPGFGRKKPFMAKAVVKSERVQVQGNKLVEENLEVIDMKGDFKAETLKSFIEKVKN